MDRKMFYLDLLKKERELLFNAKLEQSKNFDKYIFFLSSIGLGTSLTWLRDISKDSKYILFLILAWFLLFLATFLSLFSFLLSQKTIDKYIDIIKEEIENVLEERKEEKNSHYTVNNFWKLAVSIINYFSFFILFLGFGSILIFFSKNLLSGGFKMEKKENKKLITEGFTPPKLPIISGKNKKSFVPSNPPKMKEPENTENKNEK